MNVMYEMNAMDECMKDVQKHGVFPDFRQKDVGSPSQQKSRQGESSLGPLFCGRGGGRRGGGVATEKPCVFDVSRGGLRGGLSSILS